MSSNCGNCDCADKSQCVKKANQYGVVILDTQSYETEVIEFSAAAEDNGKCKCGTNCACTDCNCGN
ncbi:hypothetical protein M5K25_003409 [Dendrobium thyrsiflorum]|uniref:Uncharacterized protein n=1 Tax=Dendrobium thyrsiflorum TaxID=117978 RepID=A0ABD0VK46_DENTH